MKKKLDENGNVDVSGYKFKAGDRVRVVNYGTGWEGLTGVVCFGSFEMDPNKGDQYGLIFDNHDNTYFDPLLCVSIAGNSFREDQLEYIAIRKNPITLELYKDQITDTDAEWIYL